MSKRAGLHIIFWTICVVVMTLVYRIGMPGYDTTFVEVLMFMPLYLGYFYVVAYRIIPHYMYRRKFVQCVLALLTCIIACTLLFRIIEITVADPYQYRAEVKRSGPFVWRKLEGSFTEQLFKPVYLIHALQQSSIVVLAALSLKFFKMWYEKRQAALQSELDFLKGQIHPHFLFNTLNNLYSLTLQQSPQSPAIVMGLSNILRYMLYECNTERVFLKRDVEILQNYIALEKIRYEDRLDLTFSISGNLDNYTIPPLLMLPLVENAFKHGTSETIYEPWVNIDLQVKNNKLVFKVSNSKPVVHLPSAEKHFGKIGIRNVRKRLELLFHNDHSLELFEEEEDIFVAILELDLSQHTQPVQAPVDRKKLQSYQLKI
ncbi:MAG: histidine kinase [Chitinophagaceae bacterium]